MSRRPGAGNPQAEPVLVHAAGPHPFWGGRQQPLPVAIERDAGEVFDLLLSLGASPEGETTATTAGYRPGRWRTELGCAEVERHLRRRST